MFHASRRGRSARPVHTLLPARGRLVSNATLFSPAWSSSDRALSRRPPAESSTRARAVLVALDVIGGGWRLFARAARIVPLPLANFVYRLVARWRYRVFGRFETCQLPRREWKDRFLE